MGGVDLLGGLPYHGNDPTVHVVDNWPWFGARCRLLGPSNEGLPPPILGYLWPEPERRQDQRLLGVFVYSEKYESEMMPRIEPLVQSIRRSDYLSPAVPSPRE
ncbi:MAG: hypothetical protein H0U42_07475 [Thermoleophilaceae bacterium]|nr:hypothetical protein [Thermoleophilaceae bacterium]